MKKYKILLLIIAVSMATTIISGCGKMSEIDNSSSKLADGEIQLSFYYPNDSQAGLSDVNDKINEMLKSRLGASVKLNLIDNKAYDQKISGMISSGEEFDICWTSGGNGFYQNAAAGAFLELDKLIDEYGKGTKAGIPDFVWPAAKVDGKIYAVPNYQTMAPGFGLLFRRDFADEMKFDWRSVNKLADIEPYLKFVKEKHPEIIAPLASPGGIISTTILSYSIYFGMDVIGDKTTPGWIYIDNKDDIKVINQFESPEMMEFLRLKRSWYEKGYIRKDAATFTDTISEKRAQQIGSSYGGVDIDTIDWEREGFDYPGRTMPFCGLLGYDKKLGDTLLNTDRAAATLLAISSTSKHPEIAMKLIELLNTDVELYNTLCWGVEGKHYKKKSPNLVEVIPGGGYEVYCNWEFGNVMNQWACNYDAPGVEVNNVLNTIWDDNNKRSKVSPIMGFTFNPEPVKTQIASCNAVIEEQFVGFDCGSVELTQNYPRFLEKLKKSGADKIIAEKQKQLEAFLAKK